MLTHLAIIEVEDTPERHLGETLLKAELSLAEITAHNGSAEAAMLRELSEIANSLAEMKAAIIDLSAREISASQIPEAERELDAVVQSTEAASNAIMGHAEAIFDSDATDPGAYREAVEAHLTAIFEACAFQDITGQRIAKVCEALVAIDRRVQRFAAIGNALGIRQVDPDEEARAERRRRLLLHGPVSEGASQSDIDAMFAA